MNSRIIDEDYLQYEKFKQYDHIVADCMGYILYSSQNNKDESIYLKNFNIKDKRSQFIMQICNMINSVNTITIRINTKLRDYFKLRKQYSTLPLKYCKKIKKNTIPITIESIEYLIHNNYKNLPDNIIEEVYNEYYNPENLQKENKE